MQKLHFSDKKVPHRLQMWDFFCNFALAFDKPR